MTDLTEVRHKVITYKTGDFVAPRVGEFSGHQPVNGNCRKKRFNRRLIVRFIC
jgi:hypothetical protein